MSEQTEAEHILELSRDLLEDIELDRLSAEKLLLKANRLARLAGTDELREWLRYEMEGYNASSPISLRYMARTGRWTNREEKKGYWGPLGQQEATIETSKARIEATKINSGSGDWAFRVTNDINATHNSLQNTISQLSSVRSRVLSILHSFVSNIYYERHFANLAESTFESYKRDVDTLIAEKAGDVLTKIPSIVSRLKERDEEAVSQALSTCRRVLETFADSIFPPSDETFDLGGNSLKLDASKHQNRINVYISQRTQSSSRRTRLRQNLANLFDRVSTGVHKDVTTEEAYSLFLNVYLFLGEVLHLGNPTENQIEVK